MRCLFFTRLLACAGVAALSMAAPAWAQTAPARVARGLIVELKPGAAASADRLTAQAVHDRLASVASAAGLPAPDAAPRPVGARGYLLRFAAPLQGDALDAAARNAAANPAVQSVSPDVLMRRLDVQPNDPNFTNGNQWYLRATDDGTGGAAALNATLAWSMTTGLNGPVVAVVDSGALFGHADLASQFIPGYDFITSVAAGNTGLGRNPDASDPGDWVTNADVLNSALGCTRADVGPSSWHGSFVAGIIGAASNNGIGVAGIDWNAQILPVRVAGKCGAWLSDAIDGMRWAAGIPVTGVPDNPTPARVINFSFGLDQPCDAAFQSAIDDVGARGALVVVAAGNSNTALGNPASCAGVLAVGAVRQDGLKTYYSSFGAGMGLMAPGGAGETMLPNDWITSTANTGARGPVADAYVQYAGTSFAAPMAAGVAALMLAVNPGLTPAQLIALIEQSARPFPNNPNYPACGDVISTACNCTQQTCGAGLLDANAAVVLAGGGSSSGGGNSNGNGNGNGNSGGSSSGGDNVNGGGNSSASQGGGGATGWLWGLALWGLAAVALVQRRRFGHRVQK